MTHKNAVLSVLGSLGFAVLLDVLFYGSSAENISAQFFIFQVLFTVFLFISFRLKGEKWTSFSWVSGIFAILFTVPLFLWVSDWVALAIPFWFCANVLFVSSLFGYKLNLWHPVEIVRLGLLGLVHGLSRVTVWGDLKFDHINQKQRSVLLGLVISVPLLLIFVPLLMSADVAFSETIKHMLDFLKIDNASDVIGHTLFVGFFTFVFSGIFGAIIWKAPTLYPFKQGAARLRVESQVIVTVLSALFLFFLIVQSWYLFGGEAAFQSLDLRVTYASYAKKGFAELCVVAFVVTMTVLTLRAFHKEKISNRAKIVYSILCVETLALLVSATLRLFLYVDAYGFTSLRLFAFTSIIAIAIAIGVMWYGLVKERDSGLIVRDQLLVLSSFAVVFLLVGPNSLAFTLQKIRAGNETLVLTKGDIYEFGSDTLPSMITSYLLDEIDFDRTDAKCGISVNKSSMGYAMETFGARVSNESFRTSYKSDSPWFTKNISAERQNNAPKEKALEKLKKEWNDFCPGIDFEKVRY